MKTGEEAEETVEHMAGITEISIHEHEEAAEFSLWMMIALGVLSAGSLFLGKTNSSKFNMIRNLTFAFSLLVFASMARTGYLGGLIRHTELNAGDAANAMNTEANEAEENE